MISLTKKTITFETALAEIVEVPNPNDFKHPFLTIAKFVLADDKPNQNKQGIESEDFADVISTATDMPVKMNFIKRTGIQNHLGSIPIGHIKSVEQVSSDDGNKLVATAALYADEFPEEVQWLRDEFAKAQKGDGTPPAISYEMAYADSVTRDGTQWLKKLITLAATFVKTPAYGSRTALLALASAGDISLTDLAKEIMALAKAEDQSGTGILTDKGGKNVDEKELKELQEKYQKAQAELETARTEASTKAATISELEGKLTEKDTAIQSLTDKLGAMERAQLIDTRVRKLSDNGITVEADAEKAAKKKEFWASMSDDDFNEYVSDLLSAKKATSNPKIALASFNMPAPKPDVTVPDVTPGNLLDTIKGLAH